MEVSKNSVKNLNQHIMQNNKNKKRKNTCNEFQYAHSKMLLEYSFH